MQNFNMNNFRAMYQTLSQAQNPTQMIQNMAAKNPSMKPILDLFNKGYSPEQVFNTLCKQRGINPQEFLKQITG